MSLCTWESKCGFIPAARMQYECSSVTRSPCLALLFFGDLSCPFLPTWWERWVLMTLAHVFTTFEPKLRVSCLSNLAKWEIRLDWTDFGHIPFQSQSPFSDGKWTDWSRQSAHLVQSQCCIRMENYDWQPHKVHMYWWRSFPKEGRFCYQKGDGNTC